MSSFPARSNRGACVNDRMCTPPCDYRGQLRGRRGRRSRSLARGSSDLDSTNSAPELASYLRSEEHTSELQSRLHLVCRLLLEKKKKTSHYPCSRYTSAHSTHAD